MLYTGYFAKTKNYIEAGLEPVSVAGITPDFFTGEKWTLFAPKKELFMKWKVKQITNEDYVKEYLDRLNNSLNDEAIESMKEYIKDKNIIMCCYEKSDDFCHRHALAKWLSNKLGEVIEEYSI